MLSLFVVLRRLVAERRYLRFYAEVFLFASNFVVREPASPLRSERGPRGSRNSWALPLSPSPLQR
jgi:hypothetical protein